MEEVQGVEWCVSWEAWFIFEATGESRLRWVERRMIMMMLRVRLVNRVSTDVLRDNLGVVKIVDMIMQSRLR